MPDAVLAHEGVSGSPAGEAPLADVDVLVLGTGAAGLTAALSAATSGARVGLYEKGDRIGGTTALSSAVAWLPANRYAAAAGIGFAEAAGGQPAQARFVGQAQHGVVGQMVAVVDVADLYGDFGGKQNALGACQLDARHGWLLNDGG